RGTVSYRSPEQRRGGEIDRRTDLFACGIVFYEMTTRTLPFTGPTPMAIFEALLTKTPPPPSSINPAIPAEFDRIVSKALEKNVDLRYQTAADLRADLKRLKSGGAHDTGRTANPRRSAEGAKAGGERVPW